jgi:23S rRNA (cytosine1962-C5)-methyltransferase
LAQALAGHLQGLGGQIEMGEMALPHLNDTRLLPTSICARWSAA